MDDERQVGGEATNTEPSGDTGSKRRQRLWRRFLRFQMRKWRQRKAERERREAREEPEEKAARKTASATVWIAVFTVVLALVAIFTLVEVVLGGSDTHELAVQAKRQADKMKDVSDAAENIRKAAQDMVAQEQRIADNAKASLDASSAQNKLALNSSIMDFQREQRAWIGIGQYSIANFDNKNPFKLLIPFVNSGKSPAVLTEEAVAYSISDHFESDPGEGFSYQFEKAAAIAPQGTYVITVTNSAVPPAHDAIVGGTVFLYFMGEFRYHDVYSTAVHTTKFCLRYDKDDKTMAFCLRGNDMD